MKVLITGGGGFLGKALEKALKSTGHEVYVTDIKNVDSDHCLDVTDFFNVGEVVKLQRPDAVVHLAALVGSQPSIGAPRFFLNTNILGLLNVVDAMRLWGVEKLVYVSSWDVYDFRKVKLPVNEDTPTYPESPYGASKICAEIIVKVYSDLYNMKSVILRMCGPLYGENQEEPTIIQKILDCMAAGKTFEVWGDGSETRNFLYVEDAADACCKALDYLEGMKSNWELFVLSTEPTSVRELVETAQEIKELPVKWVPYPKKLLRRKKSQEGDSSRFRSVTGWKPQVSMDEGIRRCYESKKIRIGEK